MIPMAPKSTAMALVGYKDVLNTIFNRPRGLKTNLDPPWGLAMSYEYGASAQF